MIYFLNGEINSQLISSRTSESMISWINKVKKSGNTKTGEKKRPKKERIKENKTCSRNVENNIIIIEDFNFEATVKENPYILVNFCKYQLFFKSK